MQPVDEYQKWFGTFVAYDGLDLRVGELSECKGEPNWACIKDERDYSGLRFEAGVSNQADQSFWQIKFEPCSSSQEESAQSEDETGSQQQGNAVEAGQDTSPDKLDCKSKEQFN